MPEDATVVLKVTERDGGSTQELIGLPGWSVMEVLRDSGVDLKAECGGCVACATCHVYVLAGGENLPPPEDDETERLADAQSVDACSRLSCRLILKPGMLLHVQPAAGTSRDD